MEAIFLTKVDQGCESFYLLKIKENNIEFLNMNIVSLVNNPYENGVTLGSKTYLKNPT